MKRAALVGALAALSLAPLPRAAGAAEGISVGGATLPAIHPPEVIEAVNGGITCFLLEDHTLPMVQVKVMARGGSAHDPADEVGLAELAAMLMRSGGAGERLPDDFDAAVDGIGAKLSAEAGRESVEAGLAVLSGDAEEGMGLLFDMLFRPRFDPSRLKVARMKIEERLRREEDQPDALAARSFRQLVYGEASPWARQPDKRSLKGISLEDLSRFHGRFLRAGNLILAASGDFDAEGFGSLIERLARGAPVGDADVPEIPKVAEAFGPEVKLIARPFTQAFIRMGHLGINRHNPDRFALFLMSDILGASNFKSRLMEDIRTRRGLAYSVWSDMSPATDLGLFTVGVDTKAAQAGEVMGLIRSHLERMAEGPAVTEGELAFAKRSILARMVFEFDSAFKAVNRRAIFRFHGYPDDYWRIYRDSIARVTVKGVEDVAKRYIHTEGLKTVIVGPITAPRAP